MRPEAPTSVGIGSHRFRGVRMGSPAGRSGIMATAVLAWWMLLGELTFGQEMDQVRRLRFLPRSNVRSGPSITRTSTPARKLPHRRSRPPLPLTPIPAARNRAGFCSGTSLASAACRLARKSVG